MIHRWKMSFESYQWAKLVRHTSAQIQPIRMPWEPSMAPCAKGWVGEGRPRGGLCKLLAGSGMQVAQGPLFFLASSPENPHFSIGVSINGGIPIVSRNPHFIILAEKYRTQFGVFQQAMLPTGTSTDAGQANCPAEQSWMTSVTLQETWFPNWERSWIHTLLKGFQSDLEMAREFTTPFVYRIRLWRFPEIGVPQNHPFFLGFSMINHHFGIPPFMQKPHMMRRLSHPTAPGVAWALCARPRRKSLVFLQPSLWVCPSPEKPQNSIGPIGWGICWKRIGGKMHGTFDMWIVGNLVGPWALR